MTPKAKILVALFITLFISAGLFMHLSSDDDASAKDNHRKALPTPAQLAKLPPDGGPEYNRLVFEKSPYLLQHAGNPVDWHPWGDAAFEKATLEDKPVFLSIGYSTCHWCHVMEHESFEDSTVARLMNDAFINIKVDREERPDIDQLYMTVTQAMTGSGGWPMTIIMTPDKRPFFAGTYFPRETLYGRTGMLELVPRIQHLWQNERDKLLEGAGKVVDFLKQNSAIPAGDELTDETLNTAFHQLSSRFDSTFGGFGQAPKFPTPHNLTFLLRYWYRTNDASALAMVERTLQQMRLGGIFDHVGFGFHRYPTDQRWLLPHFEKMLYDQATLAVAYIETFQATGKPEYAAVAEEIFTYVLRDMTSPLGGFYSAEDADSEGEEGLFYLWTPEELKRVLGATEGKFVADIFDVIEGGNFKDQASGRETGDSILHLEKPFSALANERGESEEKFQERWQTARKKMFAHRKKRIHPLKDDKILTDWNGLMIAALAKAGAALGKNEYTEAAQKAADFVLTELRQPDGTLLKRYRDGQAGLPAHAEDYAFMIWGLLELYESSFKISNLRNALALNDIMLRDFWDEKNGGFYFTSSTLQDDLLVRSKEIYDGAIPSANSVAALNLVRLSRMTGNEGLGARAVAIGRAFSHQVARGPVGHTQLLSALSFWLGPSYEVVVAGDLSDEGTKEMLRALNGNFLPNRVVVFRPGDEEKPEIVSLAGYTEYQKSQNSLATAYVCQNFACKAPTTSVDEMLASLGRD